MTRLRAVAPDEAPPPKKNVAQAAKTGSQKQLLVAMRDRIAETVSDPKCPPRDLASLTKRLQDIARDIAALDALETEAATRSHAPADDTFDADAV